jgi:hypothetical protein
VVFEQRQGLEVTLSPDVVNPGETVQATVVVHGDETSKVTGAVVRLVRTEHISQHEVGVVLDYDAEGDHDYVIAEVPIEASEGPHEVSFTVPEGSLPSAAHGVDWTVKAQVFRHHGRDVKAETELKVLAPYDAGWAAAPPPPKLRRGQDFIDIEVDNRVVRPGGHVTGRVYLRPKTPVTVTELDVGLDLVNAFDLDQHSFELPTVVSPVRSSLSLSPGEIKEYAFKLTVPSDAAPSVDASRLTPPRPVLVRWSARAQAYLLHSLADNDVSIELYVYNGTAPSTQPLTAGQSSPAS